MSNPSSPTLDEVMGNVVEEFMREREEEGRRGFQESSHQEGVCGRERLQTARVAIQGGSGTKRLGDSEPAHGTKKKGDS